MSLVNSSYAQALAWSLVHFLWQGAALGLVAFLCLRYARLSVNARHALGVATLAAMMAAPVVTFAWLATRPEAPAARAPSESASRGARASGGGAPLAISVDDSVTASAIVPVAAPRATNIDGENPSLILVLIAWLAGVLALSVRLAGGWMVARRLARRAVSPATPEIRALARRLAGRLALERVVQVFESTAIAVPMMVGWLKPVVLLPAAALSGLTPDQIEALLAHELAHVRRHDYLVNLLQAAVETLLFYHPAVWWVSRHVRQEREHCCDDLAIAVCGDRAAYAAALADLAAMTTPRFALAASDGSLMTRVRRILGQPGDRHTAPVGWTPALLALLLGAALVPLLARGENPTRHADRPDLGVQASLQFSSVAAQPQTQEQIASTADRERAKVAEKLRDLLDAKVQLGEGQRVEQQAAAEQLKRQVAEYEQYLSELRRRLDELKRASAAGADVAVLRKFAEASDEEHAAKVKAFAERIAELETQRLKIQAELGPENEYAKKILGEEQLLKRELAASRESLVVSEKMRQEFAEAADRQRVEAMELKQWMQSLDEQAREELKRKADMMRQEAAMKLEQAHQDSATAVERDRQTFELLSQDLKQKLEQARQQVEELSQRLSPAHPDLIKARDTLFFLEVQVAEAMARAAEPSGNATMIYLASNAPLEAGNVITLELRGDTGRLSLPDLRISAEGTITLPWVEPVKLGGLTLQQAEETLLKVLAVKKDLIDGRPVKSITVTIVRSRRK